MNFWSDFMQKLRRINKYKLNGVQTLALGFIAVIIIGGLILSLPISSASERVLTY